MKVEFPLNSAGLVFGDWTATPAIDFSRGFYRTEPAGDQRTNSLPGSVRGLSPELQVLRSAVSPFRSPQFLKEQLQELPAVDWAQFQKLAVTQQLLHLAEPRLRQLPLSRALQKVLEYARLTYFTTLRHNLAVDNLAVQVAILFSSAGLPTLLFRGTPFVRQFYGDVGLQKIPGIDVLVRHEHARRAEEILKAIGFGHVKPGGAVADARCLEFKRHIANQRHQVNIHWHFEPAHMAHFPMQEAWESAIRYSELAAADLGWHEWDHRLNRSHVYAFSPEFQFLFALFNLAHSGFNTWISYADLCQTAFLYQAVIDWDFLGSLIEKSGARRIAYRGLTLAAAWGLNVPTSLAERIRPPFARRIEHAAQKMKSFLPTAERRAGVLWSAPPKRISVGKSSRIPWRRFGF